MLSRDVINAAVATTTTVRFLNADELPVFMKYIDFISQKFISGEVTDADTMLEAIDEFALTLIDDEDI